jgi:hypothetical protein
VRPPKTQKQTKDRYKGFSAFEFVSFGGVSLANAHTLELAQILNIPSELSNGEDETEGFDLTTQSELLKWATHSLMESPVAGAMIEDAASNGWSISLDDLDSHDFHLDVPEKQIVLNTHGLGVPSLARSEYFRNVLMVSYIRALRDVWQEDRHGGFEERYGPESILMLERVRAADCDTLSILISWELKSAGYKDLWRHMIGSDEGDMAVKFSKTLERNIGKNALYEALQATFRQWYASEDRINVCDHETLEYLDEIIAYEYEDGLFGPEHMKAINIEALSCLPDKTAYLQGQGREIMADPLYSGLNDPINQSHFMHIMHDVDSTLAGGVAFRSESLAKKIFPDMQALEQIEA